MPRRTLTRTNRLMSEWDEVLVEAQRRIAGTTRNRPEHDAAEVWPDDDGLLMVSAYEEAIVRAGGGWAYPQTDEMKSIQRELARIMILPLILFWVLLLMVTRLMGAW